MSDGFTTFGHFCKKSATPDCPDMHLRAQGRRLSLVGCMHSAEQGQNYWLKDDGVDSMNYGGPATHIALIWVSSVMANANRSGCKINETSRQCVLN